MESPVRPEIEGKYFDLEVASAASFLDKRTHLGSSGYPTTCVNLLKSIIGTGLLALPFTFSVLGPLLAIPLLALFAYFSVVGLRIYSLCGMRSGAESIGSVCKVVDWRLQVMVDCALLVMCVGTAISYFSIIGDFIPDLVSNWTSFLNRNTCVLLSGIVIVPLALIRNTEHLRYTSVLGLAGIIFLLYLSIQMVFTQGISKERGPLFQISSDGFKQLNVIVFVFTCHQNVCTIVNIWWF